jgi:hypothetical protein
MAIAGQVPVINIRMGIQALDEDLPRVLKALGGDSMQGIGWARPDELTLLVPMVASHGGAADSYLLRLQFQAYRDWPPSAQFVNPETTQYVWPQDQHHVPQLVSNECRTHANYPTSSGKGIQLICCSATKEFYDVRHSVESAHLWCNTYNFLTTLQAIRRAMGTSYIGRFPRHG